MRKNKMMRLASGLLVAVLLTTCAISGTFAKYVTSDNASDTARVAKFGVTVAASGSLFAENYLKASDDTPTSATTGITVDSSGAVGDDVVAPGTKSLDDGIQFEIKGKPEVDVNVAIAVTNDSEDIFLASGFYDNVTTGAKDIAEVTTKYEPIKYTLWQDVGSGYSKVTDAIDVNLATLAGKLEGLTKDYSANTDLATEIGKLKITWNWAIDGNDLEDTILGDLAASATSVKEYAAINDSNTGSDLVDGTDYNLQTGLTITVTVTQID